jgi:phospholipid/cholesterol/gamma-HCH transport system substrate-binding protein
MSLRRQLARRTRAIAIIAFTVVAGIASAVYLLVNERLESPFATSYTVNAPFVNVSGIAAGLGVPVSVAGVRVGEVTGSSLRDGAAVLHLQIDPHLLPRVYADAEATLVPRTPLMDMYVDLSAGGPPARPLRDGATLPLAQTRTPVDPDELLSALDADTRTWLQSLIGNFDVGLAGRGTDFRALLRALSPTVSQTRQIADLLAARRDEIRRIVHNLALLTQSLARGDHDIQQLVLASNATLGALATQDAALSQSVAQLPQTLAQARKTVGDLTPFAQALHSGLDALTPVAPRLPGLLRNMRTLLSGGGVLPVGPAESFASAAQPLARLLGPTTGAVTAAVAPLKRVAGVLNRVTNDLVYVPGGRDQGYLYWLAWFGHNLDSVVSTQDAHGSVIRGLTLVSCSSGSQSQLNAAIEQLLGVSASCRSGP